MPEMNTAALRSEIVPTMPTTAAADQLNSECFCISLNQQALQQALESEISQHELSALIQQRCPHLFAEHPVFISHRQAQRMRDTIDAIEAVVALPAYRNFVLATAPDIARHTPPGQRGVFFGYDFHVNEQHSGLIEVNTNAGGAMLNAILARAQRACCAEIEMYVPSRSSVDAFETRIIDMFQQEWALCHRQRPLASVAIIDENPEQQYLYPEFLLFQQLFERHGIHAVIAGPAAFRLENGQLWYGETPIDLVYNRLTDFYLEQPEHQVLRDAYLCDAMALTPHPQTHALYADKRNLILWTDRQQLSAWGVAPAIQDILCDNIPRTELVTTGQSERLWKARRGLFFKPAAGFGSRAAYRGDKITQRVWQEILAGQYIAQALVKPGERMIAGTDAAQALKFDLRDYVYEGQVLWTAARLYQGQTTNFRTPGGGFAPVYVLPPDAGTLDLRSMDACCHP
ncbi:hypothetical protein [Undibacterium griseum]|nr:hypothetical protein [Undibacterium griseum]